MSGHRRRTGNGSPDGYFDGVGAMTYISDWFTTMISRNPQFTYYENALAYLTSKRLPDGCTARDFSTVVRRFIHDINPFIRSPFTGSQLGEFILEKLMPKYLDAIDRLIDELRSKGQLGSVEIVEDRCEEVVQRRAKSSPATTAAAAYLTDSTAEGLASTARSCQPMSSRASSRNTPRRRRAYRGSSPLGTARRRTPSCHPRWECPQHP